jgi:hypothetical protein
MSVARMIQLENRQTNFMKSGMDVMPLEAAVNSYFLICCDRSFQHDERTRWERH